MNAARVVCSALGFRGKPKVAKTGFFGRNGQQKWLTGLRCKGTESKLEECMSGSFSSNCRKGEDAGVFCFSANSKLQPLTLEWNVSDPMLCGVDESQQFEPKWPTFIELKDITNIPKHLLVPNRYGAQEVKEQLRIAKPDIIDSTASFPWIAQIRFAMAEQSMYMCGAAIISEFFVLTSARCASRSLPVHGFIRVGDFDVSEKDEFERDYKIETLSMSMQSDEEKMSDSDIALIKIKPDENGRGITFSKYVIPACLPSAYTPYVKSMICTIGGYGRDEFFKESKFLRVGMVPLLSRKKCKEAEGSRSHLQRGLFCAGGLSWSSTGCSGDRGSPLVCKIKGRSTLLGIDSISGCGTQGKVGYYADVQRHLPWIDQEIKRMSSA